MYYEENMKEILLFCNKFKGFRMHTIFRIKNRQEKTRKKEEPFSGSSNRSGSYFIFVIYLSYIFLSNPIR